MSRQVDKKYHDLDKKMAKVLSILKLKQGDFALNSLIQPGTLSKALERNSLSDDIVDKIYDRYGVRKDYWEDGKEPIIDENHTPVDKAGDNTNKKDPETELRILRQIVIRMGETNDYLLKRLKELGG